MIPGDPYGAADDDIDDLPTLPIPRPGEWSPMAAPREDPRIAPPSLGGGLGGGASFTAAGEGAVDDPAATPPPSWPQAGRERVATEQFMWELAARLTSGMLANPARSHSSVKDAMGLFDQFLQEMHSYSKIASSFDLLDGEASRRRSHEEYFQGHRAANLPAGANPAPLPDQSAPAQQPAAAPKPEPTQPRPLGDYRPIPPGTRGPYSPGSMAGTPPPEHKPGDGEQAA
jgi:hypothetical protein